MIIKEYDNPIDFWNDTSSFLKKDLAQNNMLLGVSYQLCENALGLLYQSAIFDENGHVISALICNKLRTDNRLCIGPIINISVAEKLLDSFFQKKILINSIMGELTSVGHIISILSKKGIETNINMEQLIYKCTKVDMPIIDQDLSFRVATNHDVGLIGEWIDEYREEALPYAPPFDGKKIAHDKIGKKLFYVICKNSVPVSIAAKTRDIGVSCCVNLVYTPVKYRKNGFASIVTAKLTQSLLDSGKVEVHLFTDKNNPTSNKIYQNIGYVPVCSSVELNIV